MESQQLTGALSRLLAFDKDKLPQLDLEVAEKPEIIKDLPAEQYFADRTRINSSAIKKILRSPRHFLTDWFGGVDEDEEEPDHFRIGRAAHLMLLEPQIFRELHVVEPEFIGLTKDGKPTKNPNALDVKMQREQWRAKQKPGAIILTQEELDHLVGMIEAVLEHPIANSMLKTGVAECTIHWTDRDTGVKCKGRPDFLTFEDGGEFHLLNFKTARNIQPGVFADDALRLQYHLSEAFYADGLLEVYGRLPSTMTLFPVEKSPPYEAAVYPLEDAWFEQGRAMYKHGLQIYRRCRDTGRWPAYQQNAQMLSMPNRAKYMMLPEFDFGDVP